MQTMTKLHAAVSVRLGTALCAVGVLLWLIYGLAIVDAPLIGSSAVTFAMMSIILALKIRHG